VTEQLNRVSPSALPRLAGTAASDLVAPVLERSPADSVVVQSMRERVAARLSADGTSYDLLDPASRRQRTRSLVAQELDAWVAHQLNRGLPAPSVQDEDDLVEAVMAALGGLGRLEPLLARDDVEDIFFTGCEATMLRLSDGRKVPGPPIGDTDRQVEELLVSLASTRTDGATRDFSAAQPLLGLRLRAVGELGARLSAARDVTPRPAGTIRVHRHVHGNMDLAYELGMVDAPLRAFLRAAVLAGAKVFISGGTGTGKTFLLRSMCAEIPADKMIVTIEDEQELGLHVLSRRDPAGRVVTDAQGRPVPARPPALVRPYEAREANSEGAGALSVADLAKQALRDSPDVLVLGEGRGEEMVPILSALTNGIAGVMSTVHADAPARVFDRIVQMVRLAQPPLPPDYALSAACSLDLIVQVRRTRSHERFVSEVVEVGGINGDQGRPEITTLFGPREDGRAVPVHRPSPRLTAVLADVGFDPAWMDPALSDWDRSGTGSAS